MNNKKIDKFISACESNMIPATESDNSYFVEMAVLLGGVITVGSIGIAYNKWLSWYKKKKKDKNDKNEYDKISDEYKRIIEQLESDKNPTTLVPIIKRCISGVSDIKDSFGPLMKAVKKNPNETAFNDLSYSGFFLYLALIKPSEGEFKNCIPKYNVKNDLYMEYSDCQDEWTDKERDEYINDFTKKKFVTVYEIGNGDAYLWSYSESKIYYLTHEEDPQYQLNNTKSYSDFVNGAISEYALEVEVYNAMKKKNLI